MRSRKTERVNDTEHPQNGYLLPKHGKTMLYPLPPDLHPLPSNLALDPPCLVFKDHTKVNLLAFWLLLLPHPASLLSRRSCRRWEWACLHPECHRRGWFRQWACSLCRGCLCLLLLLVCRCMEVSLRHRLRALEASSRLSNSPSIDFIEPLILYIIACEYTFQALVLCYLS